MTLVGAYGMGKTRLAAELAGDAQREGALVLHAAGTGAPEAALAVLARARELRQPALVVIDDADRAPAEVRAALRKLGPSIGSSPVLIVATGLQAAALARLEPREAMALEPLDAGGVRAIAGFYAPGGGAGEIPVETLLAVSGGVARRVHEAASEWARQEATRRVDAAAGRTAAGRSEARALEAELAGSVVELQSARERAGMAGRDGDEDLARTVCPYKGLASFDAADAEYFFGRERLVAELVARLVGAPLLAIVGPVGQRQVVGHAGRPAARARRRRAAGQRELDAGRDPPGRAAAARAPAAPPGASRASGTACWRSTSSRSCSRPARTRPSGPSSSPRSSAPPRAGTVVVLAVRADFYGRCAAYPELSRLLGANHVLVGPMAREELRRAIERPAQRVGLCVEPELVEALLADVEGEPGALPLLSTALLELWLERDGRRLRLAAYARSGGVHGAVARLAEEAYVGLDPEQQADRPRAPVAARRRGRGGAVVRRRIALAELEGERVAEVVDAARRPPPADGLRRRGRGRARGAAARVAAAARLAGRGRRGAAAAPHLGAAARAWDADARDPGELYRGARLAAALDWAAGHAAELNAAERAFLAASRTASERAQRRLRLVLAGVAALLVLAVIAGVVALNQRGDARAEATAAEAQRLGAQALADDDLDRALLLARQGVALDDSLQTRGNLLAALLKSPAAIGVLRGDGDGLTSLDLSPDGRTLAFIDIDGTVTLLDPRTRRPAGAAADGSRPHRRAGQARPPALQPRRLAARGRRVAARRPRRAHPSRASPGCPRRRIVHLTLRFSPDGRTLFASLDRPPRAVHDAPALRRRAAAGRSASAHRRPLGPVVTLMLTPRRPARRDELRRRPTVIRDARTLRPLRSLPVGGDAAALSPDGRTMLAGGRDGSVRFLDLVTGSVSTGLGRHDGAVVKATFSADGAPPSPPARTTA